MVAKLQARLRDLESELELEQRRSRDLHASNRKMERMIAEIKIQADEDSRAKAELTETVQALTIRVKTLRRQLEEAVSKENKWLNYGLISIDLLLFLLGFCTSVSVSYCPNLTCYSQLP